MLFPAGDAGAAPSERETTRIVSLVPALTETLFAVGAGDQVVGRSDFCRFPEEALARPSVGALLNPSVEKIVLLRPTVVLLYQTQGEVAGRLEQLGIRTRLMRADRLEDVFTNLEAMGALTGRSARAEEVAARLRNQLDHVRRKAAERPRLRVLVVVSRDPAQLRNLYVSTPAHFVGELAAIAGGANVFEAGAPASVSKEQIVRANPEAILDLSPAEGSGSEAELRLREAGWRQLSTVDAVRSGRVYLLNDPRALVPGVGAGETAARLFGLLHGRAEGAN